MKYVITTLIIVFTALSGEAADLSKLLLTEKELPEGVTLMKPESVMKPKFIKGKNRVVLTEPEKLKAFCGFFLRDEGFASKFKAVSLTTYRAPLNEATIIGHTLKNVDGVKALKEAYEPLTSKVTYHQYFESGDTVMLVWCHDDEAKDYFEALAKVVEAKLKSESQSEQADK